MGGGILQLKSQSVNISDNFHGGGILQLKSQSAKISDNFHGGGVFCNQKVKVPRFLIIFMGGGYSAT